MCRYPQILRTAGRLVPEDWVSSQSIHLSELACRIAGKIAQFSVAHRLIELWFPCQRRQLACFLTTMQPEAGKFYGYHFPKQYSARGKTG